MPLSRQTVQKTGDGIEKERWIGRPPRGLRPFCQGESGRLNSRDALPQDHGATGPRYGLTHQAEALCRGEDRQPKQGDARHHYHE